MLGILALALGYLILENLVLAPRRQAADLATVAQIVEQAQRNDDSPVPPTDNSIAVLPFVDMSPGKDQEYMSDGIAEELLNLLAKIPQLRVIARTSSFSFKGKEAGCRHDRQQTAGRPRAGRLGAKVRRSHPNHRAAGSRVRQLASVVGDLRSHAR